MAREIFSDLPAFLAIACERSFTRAPRAHFEIVAKVQI